MKLFNSKAVSLMSVLMVLSVHFNAHANPLKQFAPQALKAAQVVGTTALVTSPLWVPGLMGYRYGKKQTLLGNSQKAAVRTENIMNKAAYLGISSLVMAACSSTVPVSIGAIVVFLPFFPLSAYGLGCEIGICKGETILDTLKKNKSMQKEVCNVIS